MERGAFTVQDTCVLPCTHTHTCMHIRTHTWCSPAVWWQHFLCVLLLQECKGIWPERKAVSCHGLSRNNKSFFHPDIVEEPHLVLTIKLRVGQISIHLFMYIVCPDHIFILYNQIFWKFWKKSSMCDFWKRFECTRITANYSSYNISADPGAAMWTRLETKLGMNRARG